MEITILTLPTSPRAPTALGFYKVLYKQAGPFPDKAWRPALKAALLCSVLGDMELGEGNERVGASHCLSASCAHSPWDHHRTTPQSGSVSTGRAWQASTALTRPSARAHTEAGSHMSQI